VLGSISRHINNGELAIGGAHFALPGVRLTLWLGGALTVASGLAARRRMHKSRAEVAAE
jgi:hypothetical protein